MSRNLIFIERKGRVGIIEVYRPDEMTARIPPVLYSDDAHEGCAMSIEKPRTDISGR